MARRPMHRDYAGRILRVPGHIQAHLDCPRSDKPDRLKTILRQPVK